MKKHELKNISFQLPISVFRQGDVFVAYTPSLDISTYGNSKPEAHKNFQELVLTFFESFEDSRELEQVLESLGWTKKNVSWQPPKVDLQKITLPASLMAA